MKKIPKDFLWGASTSAFQFEGANQKHGKGLTVKDLRRWESNNTNFETASDHYHHYKEDVALMAEMGFKSYRFSISWARIFPQGIGEINKKGVEFYNNLINELVQHQIEPLVTIYHFDLPLALENQGGWENRKLIVPAYVNYAKTLFELFGDRVKYWQTINEQGIMTSITGHTFEGPKTNEENYLKRIYQINHHMLIAQALVIKMYHDLNLGGKIGPTPNVLPIYPESCKPEDIDAAYKAACSLNWFYLDPVVYGHYNEIMWEWLVKNGYQPEFLEGDSEILKQGKASFIAVNYYFSQTVKAPTKHGLVKNSDLIPFWFSDISDMFDNVHNKYLVKTDFGWEIDPLGFLSTLRTLNDRYHLPMIIMENGMGMYDKLENGLIHDNYRINYLREHIKLIPQIITEGIQLLGYNPWSAIDLVSTHEGIKKRYGFIYVNIDDNGNGDYKRYKKDSFYWYQKVIESNGENLN